MATTAIVAEILIAGLQALVWISLLVLTLFGTGWIDVGALAGWEALTTIFVLAAAYVLGILIDRAADSGEKLLERWWPEPDVRTPAAVGEMRMAVYGEGGGAATFVEYQRSRLRVARATALNLLIALPVATVFLVARTDIGWKAVTVALLLAIALGLAQLGYRRIQTAYIRGLSNAYREVTGFADTEVAAAIPYSTDTGLRFLLVRTSGSKRSRKKPFKKGGKKKGITLDQKWTFPKGHRKKEDKTLVDTAQREAREEAGIEGKIDPTGELATYRWPSDDEQADDVTVHAFLLNVTRQHLPVKKKERKRDPSWTTADEAYQLLGQGRDPLYAEEIRTVLEAAVRRLGQPPS